MSNHLRELFEGMMETPLRAYDGQPDQRYKRKTHCPQGHAYSQENVRWLMTFGGNPYQECKRCRQDRRNRQQKNRYHNDPDYRQRRVEKTRRWRQRKKAETIMTSGMEMHLRRTLAGLLVDEDNDLMMCLGGMVEVMNQSDDKKMKVLSTIIETAITEYINRHGIN